MHGSWFELSNRSSRETGFIAEYAPRNAEKEMAFTAFSAIYAVNYQSSEESLYSEPQCPHVLMDCRLR
jgi:hypothetical protein